MTPGVALLTGAARRLGREMALDVARRGWSVAVHYGASADAAAETVSDALASGAPKAVALCADLGDETAAAALVDRALDALGAPPTLLVNNAAVFEPDTVRTATADSWSRHLAVNLRAPFVLTQAFAERCPPADEADGEPLASGLVVNMLDQKLLKLTPGFTSYTVSKSGLWTLTRTLAQALAPQIRVNGVAPGTTLASPRQSAEHMATQRGGSVLQRGPNPEDVCAALQYLVSARTVTGQMIAVDGGQHLAWKTSDIVGRPG